MQGVGGLLAVLQDAAALLAEMGAPARADAAAAAQAAVAAELSAGVGDRCSSGPAAAVAQPAGTL